MESFGAYYFQRRQAWRSGLTLRLRLLVQWAQKHGLLEPTSAARIADMQRRLESDTVSIAFIGEMSRGKSELINAVFFGHTGARLLPVGPGRTTMCPVETRAHSPTGTLNLSHPMLDRGVRIFDTPGLNALGAEPELTLDLLPQCDVIAFVLTASARQGPKAKIRGDATLLDRSGLPLLEQALAKVLFVDRQRAWSQALGANLARTQAEMRSLLEGRRQNIQLEKSRLVQGEHPLPQSLESARPITQSQALGPDGQAARIRARQEQQAQGW